MTEYCAKIENEDDFEYENEQIEDLVDRIKEEYKDVSGNPSIYYAPNINSICFKVNKTKKATEKFQEITRNIFKKGKFTYQGIDMLKPEIVEFKTTKFWKEGELLKDKDDIKWTTLVHNGPFFPDLELKYDFMNSSLIYAGKPYSLNEKEEKVACFYAARIISEKGTTITVWWTDDEVFNTNFWNSFTPYLRDEYRKIMRDFSKADWSDVVTKLEHQRELNKTESVKRKKKEEKLSRDKKYKYGFLDGNQQEIAYNVELAGIFMGRGLHPKRGTIKKQIMPEDVTINVSKGVEVIPPKGHKWKDVIEFKNGEYLGSYKDEITDVIKYIEFSRVGSIFSGKNEMYKFEMVRKLNMNIETVREKYMSLVTSDDLYQQQLGTVVWLMDNYGVRVGTEKDTEEEADTVGATTLRVGHLTLEENNTIHFNFSGKDSIQFDKKIKDTPDVIFRNFKSFMRGKSPNDQLFNKVESKNINDYLKTFDKRFIAKFFRTRLASSIMFNALKDVTVPEGSNKAKIKALFNSANSKVADVLNHVKTISKKAQEKVNLQKEELKELKKKSRPNEKDKKKIEDLEIKISDGENTQSVALNTSLKNYIDPRIVVSWADREEVKCSDIYSASLMKQFEWAIDMKQENWDYEKTPLCLEHTELQPAEVNKSKKSPGQTTKSAPRNSNTSASTKAKKDSNWIVPARKTDKVINVKDVVEIIDYDKNFIVVTGNTMNCRLDKIRGERKNNLKDKSGKTFYGYQFPITRKREVFLHLLYNCPNNFNPSKNEIFDNKYFKDCKLLIEICEKIKKNPELNLDEQTDIINNLKNVDKEVWKVLYPFLKNAYENNSYKSSSHKRVINIYYNYCKLQKFNF
jgi:DNA topoisomerase-1